MSPELAVVLFFALLWGPTLLWLLYRALRGPGSRLPESFTRAADMGEAMQFASDAQAQQGYWVCEACHSMNLRGAKRCYSCKAAREVEAQPVPDAAPAAQPVAQPVGHTWIPVMDADLGRSAGTAAAVTMAGAVALAEDPAPKAARRARGRASAASTPTSPVPPVCPYLGFKDDPATRCSYPDPRNVCHARSDRGASPLTVPRRLIAGAVGGSRTQEVGPEDQATLCLTAEHEQCARYPALHVLAGTR